MVVRAGLGLGGDVPHVWVAARDSGKFTHASLSIGGRGTEQVHGSGHVKFSTGSFFWDGARVAVLPRLQGNQQQGWLSKLIHGERDDSSDGFTLKTKAPAGTRFGVKASAHGTVGRQQAAGNGHQVWTLAEPGRVTGQGFVVQELPLPIGTTTAGSTWLKVKVTSPSASAFVEADRSVREGPVQQGLLTASVNSDVLVGDDYSKLALGLKTRYSTSSHVDNPSLVVTQAPLELFAKLQHNKQRLTATYQRRHGVRVLFTRAF